MLWKVSLNFHFQWMSLNFFTLLSWVILGSKRNKNNNRKKNGTIVCRIKLPLIKVTTWPLFSFKKMLLFFYSVWVPMVKIFIRKKCILNNFYLKNFFLEEIFTEINTRFRIFDAPCMQWNFKFKTIFLNEKSKKK